ncbi:MAG: hypothetical protein BZ137_09325 [Methanosphaera sp. rholeuAM130]|nr:MAG: hypothetical protein BZ137_09325 [Methanosphaera sp. rholeuAM130]
MKRVDLRKREHNDDKGFLNKINLTKNDNNVETSTANIFEIMKKDARSAFTNPIVILLLLGIIILPSLYSLVNIYACWDPYEETGNVKFAIANEDHGAQYQNYTVNVGNDLITSLSNNTDFKWEFVSSEELRRGVHNGTYYAGIIIPHDFSKSIVSITTEKPHTANLEYLVNEKTNPVGAKLTDAASKAVFNKLNSEIVAFINVAALDKLGELQSGLAEGAQEMGEGADKLSAGADKVASGADQIDNGANKLSRGADELASGATELSRGAVKIADGADQVAMGTRTVAEKTEEIEVISNDTYETFKRIKNAIENNSDSSRYSEDIDKLDADTAAIAERLRDIDSRSKNVSIDAANLSDAAYNLSNDASILETETADESYEIHEISTQFDNVSSDITRLKEKIRSGADKSDINRILDEIDTELYGINKKIGYFNNQTHLLADGSENLSIGSHKMVNGSKQLADGSIQLSNGVHILSNGTIELAAGAELLGYASASALQNASDALGVASDQLYNVTRISDDDAEDYFLGPVKLQRYEEFPANNYGSQVSPFYLVLSMWVGALINTVLLKTGSSVGTKYRPHEMYFGKLLIFNIMAILQTTVTLIGACILGIDIYNGPVFVLTCYFVAIMFMAIIYSLASLFGEVGKGIAILLLVFQISGSGGIYPVEIMNTIFGILYPFLPMTHAINIVREAQLGLIWSNYIPSFIYLLLIGIGVIIAATLLKQRWDKRTKFFEDKLKESGLFN